MPRGDRRLAPARKYILQRLAEDEAEGYTQFEWLGAHDIAQCMGCRSRDRKVFTAWQIREILAVEFCFPDLDRGDKQGCRCLVRPYRVGPDNDASGAFQAATDRQAWIDEMKLANARLQTMDQWSEPTTYRDTE